MTVSNFGNLAADEENVLFENADRLRIDDERKALGCTNVSEHLLRARYDGVSRLRSSARRTWWDRFFDHL